MGPEMRNCDIEDSLERIFDDVEAFLGRWMDRFGGVLEQFRTLAEREQDLATREASLEQSKSDFKRQQQRWATQRDDELSLLQQQVEELTEAWLRLENEQRVAPTAASSAVSVPPVEEDRTPMMPDESGPESPSVLSPTAPKPETDGQPFTRSSQATPAPIPAALKSRASQMQGSHHDPGRPPTISQTGPTISQTGNGQPGEANRAAAAHTPPTRESCFEHFQQLQREVGLNMRPRP